jgi:CRISPR/Cas system-associated exonuclease Cas4 (RecB family)
MRIIRASEIGSYLYCQRAWWYQVHGYQPENTIELARGKEIHAQHSRGVRLSQGLALIALFLILAAIVMAALWFLQIRF